MRSAVDEFIPGSDLDAAFERAIVAVDELELPVRRNDVLQALRGSLRVFVRSELRKALDLDSQSALLPERLRCYARTPSGSLYEVLRELAQRRATQWASGVVEFLTRIQCDWTLLLRGFSLAPDVAVAAVSPPLGDLHHNGRAVCRVSFSDGHSVIYKPRSVETEAAFGAILSRLAEDGCRPRFQSCHTLRRDGYGWTEYLPTAFCETEEEIEAFYRRQGGFLALFWLLGASDAIAENIVAAGEHPVWVDLECMCRPELSDFGRDRTAFPLWLRESILATAMVLDDGARAGAFPRTRTGLSVSCTRDRTRAFAADDVLRPPLIRAVVQGFEDVYRWFLSNERARSLHDGPLAPCFGLRVRVILRPTRLYEVLVNVLATTPASSRASVTADIRHVLCAGNTPQMRSFPESIVQGDIFAVVQGDIPYWSTSTSSQDLKEVHGGSASGVAAATCLECIQRRLRRMNEIDLAQQVWLLESFLGRTGHARGVG